MLRQVWAELPWPITGVMTGTCTCLTVFSLFIEPMVGQVQVGKREDNSRSRRNPKHIYALLTGGAAAAEDVRSPLLLWLAQWTRRNAARTYGKGLFRRSSHTLLEQQWPAARRAHSGVNVQCCPWALLLHKHVFTTRGARGPDHYHLASCSLPAFHPCRVSQLHRLHAACVPVFPWRVTRTSQDRPRQHTALGLGQAFTAHGSRSGTGLYSTRP